MRWTGVNGSFRIMINYDNTSTRIIISGQVYPSTFLLSLTQVVIELDLNHTIKYVNGSDYFLPQIEITGVGLVLLISVEYVWVCHRFNTAQGASCVAPGGGIVHVPQCFYAHVSAPREQGPLYRQRIWQKCVLILYYIQVVTRYNSFG